MRCLYVDLDGTLLGPGASLVRGAGGGFSLDAVRALQACDRAGVEVVLYSGRRQGSVFECARLIDAPSFIFEVGCGLVLDGELEWLTGGIEPSESAGSIYDQIEASGAPALLLETFEGRLQYHTPWSIGREVSHLFRGDVPVADAQRVLDRAGLDWLRILDNGVLLPAVASAGAAGAAPENGIGAPGSGIVRAYHLIPAAASKAHAVARHMQARAYGPGDCIAVGDSREDMGVVGTVQTFWLVANALERDPSLAGEITGQSGVRTASGAYGAGVYEAVVSTLAERA